MFEPEMVAVLEQARGLGQGGAVMVESAEFDYIVDLDAMEQENQRTGNVRKVQRLDTGGAEPVRKRPAALGYLLAVGSHAAVATRSTTVASKTNEQTVADRSRSRSRSPLTTTTKTCAACVSQGHAPGACHASAAPTSSAATASAAPSTR